MTYQVGTPAKPGDVYRKGPIELRCGDYRDVLADVDPDAVITDPPYSVRQHRGYRSQAEMKADAERRVRQQRSKGLKVAGKINPGVPYAPIDAGFAAEAAARFVGAAWFVAFGDHVSARWWEAGLDAAGWYVFAPVVWVRAGSSPRFQGDGPANACEWITVARPRRKVSVGSLPGAYFNAVHSGDRVVTGQKPVSLMRAIVRDYSRPGDLVCDPCAGGATTLIAAALEGRRAIGAELDPETFTKACARIERTALTPPLPGLEASPMTQEGLDL